jgi:hypothetical protein
MKQVHHVAMIFLSILWLSHISEHPQEKIVKFGYMLKGNEIILIILHHFGNLLKPIVYIWQFMKKFPLNFANLQHFFIEILSMICTEPFLVSKWQKFTQKMLQHNALHQVQVTSYK